MAKKFSHTQLKKFFLLLGMGTSVYRSEKITENFNDIEILKYKYLIEKKVTPYFAELTVMNLRREGEFAPNMYSYCNNLKPSEIIEFLNIN